MLALCMWMPGRPEDDMMQRGSLHSRSWGCIGLPARFRRMSADVVLLLGLSAMKLWFVVMQREVR